MGDADAKEATQIAATNQRVLAVEATFERGEIIAKYLSKAKTERVIIEHAMEVACEKMTILQDIFPKGPSLAHEWFPRNMVTTVGIMLKIAMKRSPTWRWNKKH